LLKTHYIVEGFSNSVTSANPVAGQPTPEPQNLSWREAIVEVLKGANGAMHYSDIADEIVARRLRSEIGPTPVNTVAAIISLSISKQGEQSEFIRAGRGEYMLRSLYEPGHQQPSLPEPTAEELEKEVDAASEESTGIIQALGMYWSRSLIVWTNNPTLQGQQQTGAKPVDFSNQRGVYLLYDDRDVIYVGRATDQGLGKRLYQHTVDRLASRWNRFSWFGIRRVTPDGTLAEEQPKVLPQEVIVATMEALLIEGLEPPQNRRRGDDFRAIEYIQREDPELERRRLASLLGEIQSRLNLR
jgi:hypothetical protein